MSKATTPDATLPKTVQRWSASDYARNGRFVQELAGPVFAMLAPTPGERILDLGCGDGALTAEIKASGADVLGVDLSDELLAVARMKGLAVSAKWTDTRSTSSPSSMPYSPTPRCIGCASRSS
jgi:2-polyprenyl-3-methyl-5-hydroxy-6-metoxy-1,4-benzoquinol methylase